MVDLQEPSKQRDYFCAMAESLIGRGAKSTIAAWGNSTREFLNEVSQLAYQNKLTRESLALDLWLIGEEMTAPLCLRAFKSAIECVEADIARSLFPYLDAEGFAEDEAILALAMLELAENRVEEASKLLLQIRSTSLMKRRLWAEVLLRKEAYDARYVAANVFRHSLSRRSHRLEQFLGALHHAGVLKNDPTIIQYVLNNSHEDNILPILSYLARENLLENVDGNVIDRVTHDISFWKNRLGKPSDQTSDFLTLNEIYFDEGLGGVGTSMPFTGLAAVRSTPVLQSPSNALVSVIICAYNATDTIETSIRSIAAQSYDNIEIIIVDDCSHTPVEVDPSWANGRAIIVSRNSYNIGPYLSRNVGLEAAQGDFICFHDADDWAHPDKISHQIRDLLVHNALAHYGGHIRMRENGDFIPENNGRFIGDGPITGLFDRSVFDRCGMFLQTRTRGDVEFRRRITRFLGEERVRANNVPYVIALDWNSNSKIMTNTLFKERAVRNFLSRSEMSWPLATFARAPGKTNRLIDETSGFSAK
ncbi:glycosyltransferase family 2 protein (plasmid) [Roseivivax marinus]|uniref:glycosyltransferase family A protein n=1 Tax=Roseivivax marinus TaxID=1379903 RepID=UPI001F03F17A|nr:glycosyltransferase family A protein [Roseivivax marinus]UMA67227.1 glycosyltransferase family 2 protein [Roseivivax marinus]